jgi:iron-sulfur cluster insertion protein
MNEGNQELDTSGIIVTPGAISRIKEILAEEEQNSRLRIFVQGGGCSGFTYGFAIETTTEDDDIHVNSNPGSTIVTDPVSLGYLRGSVVDFVETIHGSNFQIENPNAETTCGCGSSFSPF